MEGIKIRGHHLRIFEDLIKQEFIKRSGYYTIEEFKIYFREPSVLAGKEVRDCIVEMYRQMTENPHSTITVVDSIDDICVVCGKHDGKGCINVDERNNKKIDLRVIKDYCMIPDRSYSSDDFLFKLSKNIKV